MEMEVNILLKQAEKTTNAEERLRLLYEIEQLIMDEKSSTLLNDLFDEIVKLVFRFSNFKLKSFLLSLCGSVCCTEVYFVERAVPIVLDMLSEADDHLLKKILASMTLIYRSALKWILQKPPSQFGVDPTWHAVSEFKTGVLSWLESENEGIKIFVFKFLEHCILAQIKESSNLKSSAYGCQLATELQASNDLLFSSLTRQLIAPHISLSGLSVCLKSLTNIVRNDAEFLDRFLECCKKLVVDIPPTLSHSQVESLFKVMRFHLTTLINLPCFSETVLEIAAILQKLGISPSELARLTGISKYKLKRSATEDNFNAAECSTKRRKSDPQAQLKRICSFFVDTLTPDNCVELVLASFPHLPKTMPEKFLNGYVPIDSLPINEQIERISSTIASVISTAGLSCNLKLTNKRNLKKREEKKDTDDVDGADDDDDAGDEDEDDELDGEKKGILSNEQYKVQSASKSAVKKINLADKVAPLSTQDARSVTENLFERILNLQKFELGSEDAENQRHILITMCSLYENAELKDKLLQKILTQTSSSGELALRLLYYQYSLYLQLRKQANTTATEKALNQYNNTLVRLLSALLPGGEIQLNLFCRLVVYAPQLSVQALQVLKQGCKQRSTYIPCLNMFTSVIKHRPGQRKELFGEFASLSTFDDDTAIVNGWLEKLNALYKYPPTKDLVKELALNHLHLLEQAAPPDYLLLDENEEKKWDERSVRICFRVYCHLLPQQVDFLQLLPDVYVACGVNVKRLINTYLSKPIKQSSIPVNDIVQLVKQCPRNAEALIPRILEPWLDKNSLNAELVNAVWTLYTKRRPDVRFLVPILPALNNEQFISLLPKLIRLPAQIFKMITGKVVCSSGSKTVITAEELWLKMCELEVKNENDSTQLLSLFGTLLQNKQLYNSDLLSGIIKQISERQVVPVIFFHTIPLLLEAQASLDSLIGSVLQNFVTKQIWKQGEDVWQAFVQCSSKLKIHGYAALLQLPASQLRNAIETCPELRQDLLNHVENMESQQRASITKDCMNELEEQQQVAAENDDETKAVSC
ncbi:Symplekin [Trichinella pseudospiralis]|uniref:Symplekin n=1 Tax=Trichinella pseudospiralis TaxID=6337 RepID=A0A0V0YM68_TRIPS|nr:Symplekin [Trichinella pseudospiralis]KRY72980.1 Symplekin [Trichinella pseudospiralis]KRZ34958.1 Symplekin [Trichinella pseudospiralis]KRZ44028.1 Symplekin [Trichinella pseudospiralis]